jgi:hypothetical protein
LSVAVLCDGKLPWKLILQVTTKERGYLLLLLCRLQQQKMFYAKMCVNVLCALTYFLVECCLRAKLVRKEPWFFCIMVAAVRLSFTTEMS